MTAPHGRHGPQESMCPHPFVMFAANLSQLLAAGLDYLADRLPPPVYSALIALVSRSLVFVSSISTFVASLVSADPSHWNPQQILPPLITLLCAYLALLTIYRTTTWAIRTIFWFFKWGFILSIIFTGMGWYLHDTAGGLGPADSVRAVLDAINYRTPQAAGGMQSTSIHSSNPKPQVWDTFESHRRWRETLRRPDAKDEANLEGLIRSVLGPATGFLEQGGQWWQVAKSIVIEKQFGDDSKDEQRKSRGKSRSR